MEVFLSILVVLIFYLILVTLISLIRALFSIRKGKKYAKETFLLLPDCIIRTETKINVWIFVMR